MGRREAVALGHVRAWLAFTPASGHLRDLGQVSALSEPQLPDEYHETDGSEASGSDPFLVSAEAQDPLRSRS